MIPLILLIGLASAEDAEQDEAPRLRRASPHHAAVAYDAEDPSCAACHVSVPPRGTAPSEARLRTEPARACATCHPSPPHRGVVEHVGRTVRATVRDSLPPSIALTDEGTVQCWTCHDVHAGVGAGALGTSRLAHAVRASLEVDGDWPGAPRPRPALLALPLEGGALCRACHGAGP